jgi:hypothetical protein
MNEQLRATMEAIEQLSDDAQREIMAVIEELVEWERRYSYPASCGELVDMETGFYERSVTSE